MTRPRAGRRRNRVFDCQQREKIFIFKALRLALKPSQPPTLWTWVALYPGVKLSGREADHHVLPRLRMRAAVPPLPSYAFTAWCLVKHRDNFTCPFTCTGYAT